MILEQLVPSLELCRELKENGYPQETVLAWYENGGTGHLIQHQEGLEPFPEKTFAAPTSSEIGEQLPEKVDIKDKGGGIFYLYFTYEKSGQWYAQVNDMIAGCITEEYIDDNEANSRAKLWLYLKRNNLLEEHE